AAGREYAYVVSVASGARTHVFRHRGTKSVAFSPDGRLLATGSADDSAKVWRLRDGREVATFDEHTGDVLAVEFDPAGSLLATASADSGVRVWRLEDGERRFLFVGHNNPTVALAWSPDGRFIADASLDRTGRILDIGGIGAGRMAAVVIGHEAGLAGVAYSRDGRRLVTVGQDGTARVWDGRAEHELRLLARHRPGETRATFGRDGRSVLSWGADGAFVTQIGGATRRIAAGPIADAELDAAGSTIATAGPTHAFLHGRSTATLRHRRPPVDVEFTADGRVVTASPDGWARIFARDGRLLAHLDHGEPVTRLATATGSIATAAAGGTVRIWRGGDVLVLPGHEGAVNALRFSPDATLLVSAGDDGVVRAWDALDGSLAYALPGHLGGATDAAFSPSGAGLVTTDRARHVRLWAAADGAPRRDLIGHFAPVNSVAFSGDGRWLVTTSALAAALWQATEGAPFAYLRGHTAPVVRSAAFAPDGRRIVTAGDDGTVRVYRCEVCGGTDDLVALARRRLANARVTR
ncbi:MAG TPA: WD40 repeat domain-containing protein, partial [Actinomycetota bacterium]